MITSLLLVSPASLPNAPIIHMEFQQTPHATITLAICVPVFTHATSTVHEEIWHLSLAPISITQLQCATENKVVGLAQQFECSNDIVVGSSAPNTSQLLWRARLHVSFLTTNMSEINSKFFNKCLERIKVNSNNYEIS